MDNNYCFMTCMSQPKVPKFMITPNPTLTVVAKPKSTTKIRSKKSSPTQF